MTPRAQETAISNALRSRRGTDITGVKCLPKHVCCVVRHEDDDVGGTATLHCMLKAAPATTLKADVALEIHLSASYPTVPPKVRLPEAKDREFVFSSFDRTAVIDEDGLLTMNLLREETGWSRTYNLEAVVYAVAGLFTDDSTRSERCIVLDQLLQIDDNQPCSASAASTCAPHHVTPLGVHYGEIGARRTMEDAALLHEGVSVGGKEPSVAYLYCVFDGHGGGECSAFAAQHFSGHLLSRLNEGLGWRAAQWQAYQDVDAAFVAAYESKGRTGSTGLSVLLDSRSDLIRCANLGDCRAVLCRQGKAIDLSSDCRADRPDELARIVSEGGFVMNSRVRGQLAVSRGLGDASYKEPGAVLVSNEPELSEIKMCSEDSFIVLACDGVWDVLTSQNVVDFVVEKLAEAGNSLADVCRLLVRYCVNDLKTKDNVSCILVDLQHRGTSSAPPPQPRWELHIDNPIAETCTHQLHTEHVPWGAERDKSQQHEFYEDDGWTTPPAGAVRACTTSTTSAVKATAVSCAAEAPAVVKDEVDDLLDFLMDA